MSYFTKSFIDAVQATVRTSQIKESKDDETPASHLASWAKGGDIISQISSHSISHNYRHNNSDLVVAHEKMRDEAIKHMERLHDMAKYPEDRTHAAKAITHLRNAKVNENAYPKMTLDRYK